jgi:V8-like Glu-specific endopeptidase
MKLRAILRSGALATAATTLAGSLLAGAALAITPAAAVDSPIVPGKNAKVSTVAATDVDAADTPANVRAFWNSNRLQDAGGGDVGFETLPAPSEVLTPKGDKVGYGYPQKPYLRYGTRGVGKIVLLNGTQPSNCSAAAIGGDFILTAAHCVLLPGGKFLTKLAFVPDYRHGKSADGKNRDNEPFGVWPVTKTYMPKVYATKHSFPYDIAVMRVAKDPQGASLQEALRVSYKTIQSKDNVPLDTDPALAAVYGYPGEGGKKFDNGPEMFYCIGEMEPDDQRPISELVTSNCAVQGGNSGGPLFDKKWNIIGVTQSGTKVTGADGKPAENSVFSRLHPDTFGASLGEAKGDTGSGWQS